MRGSEKRRSAGRRPEPLGIILIDNFLSLNTWGFFARSSAFPEKSQPEVRQNLRFVTLRVLMASLSGAVRHPRIFAKNGILEV